MKTYLPFLLSILVLISCSEDDGNQTTGNVPQYLWGEWRSIDTGNSQILDINSTLTYTEITSRQLQVIKTDDSIDYLIRSGGNTAQVTGIITKPKNQSVAQKNTGLSGIAGIDIILSNIDSNEMQTTTTDNNGEFTASNLPSGDYVIEATDTSDNTNFISNIEIKNTENNLGAFNLADPASYNFKTEAIFIDPYLFGDYTEYTGKIRINNTGAITATGLGFQISCDDPIIESCILGNATGTVEPGGFKDISITIQFKYLDTISHNLKIPVVITDAFGKQWNDITYITVYKTRVNVNLTAGNIISPNSPLNGFIISNTSELTNIATYYDTKISIPNIPSETFRLVFSANKIFDEKTYSIGLNMESTTRKDLLLFTNTSSFEDNNTAGNASALNLSSVTDSYLHVGDIDFFEINMPNQVLPDDAVILNYHDRSAFRDESYIFSMTSGNGDGILNAGETAAFEISLINNGTSDAKNITVSISTSDIYVTVADGTETDHTIRSLLANKANKSIVDVDNYSEYLISSSTLNTSYLAYPDDFNITVDPATPANHQATIDILMTDSFGNTWNDSFTITVQ